MIQVGETRFRQSIIRDITQRKAMDEKLRRMLDAHTAVIDSSAAAIVTLSSDFHVTTWNKAAERMFGWTAEETMGSLRSSSRRTVRRLPKIFARG